MEYERREECITASTHPSLIRELIKATAYIRCGAMENNFRQNPILEPGGFDMWVQREGVDELSCARCTGFIEGEVSVGSYSTIVENWHKFVKQTHITQELM